MKQYDILESVKNCFLDHAELWMSPVNVIVVKSVKKIGNSSSIYFLKAIAYHENLRFS